jgi:Uma2 family endonuclease
MLRARRLRWRQDSAMVWKLDQLDGTGAQTMSMGEPRTVQRHVGVDDYLRDEELSDRRHEYVDGAVFAMSGASNQHNEMIGSLFAHLKPQLKSPCRSYMIDVKLRLQQQRATIFYYPDYMVTCEPRGPVSHWILAPSLIVEILSPSTERTDRTEKLMAYTQLPSLEAYLLVAQDETRVEALLRSNAWTPQILGAGELINLPGLGVEIAIDAIYAL